MSTDIARAWQNFLAAAEREADQAASRDPLSYPHYSEDGAWVLVSAERRSEWLADRYEHGNWTFGFWFGVMWLLALGGRSGGARLARERISAVLDRSDDRTTHDIGFIVWPSLVLGRMLGQLDDDRAEPAGLVAAQVLADRYNAAGEYIQAFGAAGDPRSAGTSTIDTMMNLPLLWWAADYDGGRGDRYYGVARSHALRSAREFVRADASTYHLLQFDPDSGDVLSRGTFQGAGDDSCWSRGQAWAIAGFAITFGVTADADALSASERTADYFWARLPEDGVPAWDFSDPAGLVTRDASAAAIAALGALVLAEVHPQEASRRRYDERARRLLVQLDATCVNRSEGEAGILLRSVYSKPHGLGVDGASGWGDFYYGLALAIASGHVSARDIFGLRHPAARAASRG
jgi:unsaturated chondroitin disaccharide hydrolase